MEEILSFEKRIKDEHICIDGFQGLGPRDCHRRNALGGGKRTCRHCIECSGLTSHKHSLAHEDSVISYLTLQHQKSVSWWPAGTSSPTHYFIKRREVLACQLKSPIPLGTWQRSSDILGTDPSLLLLSRGVFPLSVLVPASRTNIHRLSLPAGKNPSESVVRIVGVQHIPCSVLKHTTVLQPDEDIEGERDGAFMDPPKRCPLLSVTGVHRLVPPPPAVYPGTVLQHQPSSSSSSSSLETPALPACQRYHPSPPDISTERTHPQQPRKMSEESVTEGLFKPSHTTQHAHCRSVSFGSSSISSSSSSSQQFVQFWEKQARFKAQRAIRVTRVQAAHNGAADVASFF